MAKRPVYIPQKNGRLAVTEKDIEEMDALRKSLELMIKLPKGFVLPGSNKESAYLDWARSVCRRCEREIVEAYNTRITDNKNILMWMNRLSDFLYLMARYVEDTPKVLKRQGKNRTK